MKFQGLEGGVSMRYRALGNTGLMVSEIGLGAGVAGTSQRRRSQSGD